MCLPFSMRNEGNQLRELFVLFACLYRVGDRDRFVYWIYVCAASFVCRSSLSPVSSGLVSSRRQAGNRGRPGGARQTDERPNERTKEREGNESGPPQPAPGPPKTGTQKPTQRDEDEEKKRNKLHREGKHQTGERRNAGDHDQARYRRRRRKSSSSSSSSVSSSVYHLSDGYANSSGTSGK